MEHEEFVWVEMGLEVVRGLISGAIPITYLLPALQTSPRPVDLLQLQISGGQSHFTPVSSHSVEQIEVPVLRESESNKNQSKTQ